jgi:hypothetical protein
LLCDEPQLRHSLSGPKREHSPSNATKMLENSSPGIPPTSFGTRGSQVTARFARVATELNRKGMTKKPVQLTVANDFGSSPAAFSIESGGVLALQ